MSRATATGEVLSRRALNRATLARQMLLRREATPALAAMERLVGLQAQTPHSWYVGLWSRLDEFQAEEAADLLTGRQAVRIALMRGTIHLVSARDCLIVRPLVQPVIDRSTQSTWGKRLQGIDLPELVAAGRELVEERPLTPSELGRRLAERWPAHEPEALATAIRAGVPLVQVPPRGVWGKSGPIAQPSAEAWLGRPLDLDPSLDDLVLRYLAAFGPASIRDIQTWSGLTRLREVIDRLRPGLVTVRDEAGRELFDLPNAPRPDPETPAPVRFLYEFDNLLLSHADRSRVIHDLQPIKPGMTPNGVPPSHLLIDGFTGATWRVERAKRAATLLIEPFVSASPAQTAEIEEEGTRLLAFLAPDAESREVCVASPA